MKNLLFLCLLLVGFQTKAQDTVTYKIKYLPNHKYLSTLTNESYSEMNIEADKEVIEKLKSRGVKLPLILIGKSTVSYEVQTGDVKENKEFPLVIKYTGVKSTQTINGEEKVSPPSPLIDAKIYSHSNDMGETKIDSIPGKGINDSLRNLLYSTVKAVQTQIKFPAAAMKIGDTFEQQLPLSMPIAGNNFQIVVKVTYKLVEIKNNMAYFDLDESASAKLTMQQGVVNMIGKGDGKMTFDIGKHFSPSIISSLEFDYSMQSDNITMKGKANTKSMHKTEMD